MKGASGSLSIDMQFEYSNSESDLNSVSVSPFLCPLLVNDSGSSQQKVVGGMFIRWRN